MKLFVVVDIGCIECGAGSAVLGVFTEEKRAQSVCDDHEQRQKNDWHGQHSFEIFPIDVDVEYRQEYKEKDF